MMVMSLLSSSCRDLLSVVLVADSKLLTALGAARSKYAAAVLGGHTLAETMLVHAAAVVRLKCSFHCFLLFCLLKIPAKRPSHFWQKVDFGLQRYTFLSNCARKA